MNEKVRIEIDGSKTVIYLLSDDISIVKEIEQLSISQEELSEMQYLFLQRRGYKDATMPKTKQEATLIIGKIKRAEGDKQLINDSVYANLKPHVEGLFDIPVKRKRGRPRKIL